MQAVLLALCLVAAALVGLAAAQEAGDGPRILTAATTMTGEEGGSVRLPCEIQNLGRKSVFWLKGPSLEERQLIMQMRSVRRRLVVPRQYHPILRSGKMATQGANLIVNRLTPEDAGLYTCTVAWANQTVTHTVTVGAPTSAPDLEVPEIELEYDPATQEATVATGETATFTCQARGTPDPVITWYKQGVEGGAPVSQDTTLTLERVNREDAGSYLCQASNGVSQPQTATFVLNVKYVAVEAVDENVVVDSEDAEASLACRVTGDPEPQVVWYNAQGPVVKDETRSYEVEGDIHYLEISEVTPEDLGQYQCYVYNDVARELATVMLTARPGPVHALSVRPASPYPPTFTLSWRVNSLVPVDYYLLSYAQIDSEDVVTINVAPTQEANEDGQHEDFAVLSSLAPDAQYQVLDLRAVSRDGATGPQLEAPYAFSTAAAAAYDYGDDYDGNYDGDYEPYDPNDSYAPTEPYAPAPQPYAPTHDPYAPAPQPYTPTSEPYAPAPQPYAPTSDPYAPAPQPYAPTSDPYAPAHQPYAPAPEVPAPAPQQYAPASEVPGPATEPPHPYHRPTATAPRSHVPREPMSEETKEQLISTTLNLLSRLPKILRALQ